MARFSTGISARGSSTSGMVWLVVTLAITAAFARLAVRNLANYGPVSNDEAELIAVSYKLATQGVLGSDMYAGLFGRDEHHLVTLPLQHILDAVSFRLFGAGIAQARGVSLVAAVALVWIVGWLAFRWYGLAAAVLAELLLVGWSSNLTAASDGLSLLGVARTARYDVLAVVFAWAAIALLDLTLRRPDRLRALLSGACSGLAALSQFFGIFVLALLGAALVLARTRRWADTRVGWAILGASIVLGPWAAYAARHADDLAGQLSVYGDRGDFLSPAFYVANVMAEPMRYSHLVQGAPHLVPSPISQWLLILAIWPAAAYVAWRARVQKAVGDRLLLLSLVTFGGLLLLLDQTKVPLYAILLLPSICLSMAACWAGLFRRSEGYVTRLAVGGISLVLLIALALESVRSYQVDYAKATQVTPYLSLGQQIDDALVTGGTVLGPERWWWPLREHPYLSLRSLWWQWAVVAVSNPQPPDFADWVSRTQADNVIVNINVREDIQAFPEPVQAQFWSFIDRCTTQVRDLPNANYFEIEVYRVNWLRC